MSIVLVIALASPVLAAEPSSDASDAERAASPIETLRVASCQFPVGSDIASNGEWIRRYMRQAKEADAHLLHTSEASLSGYAGVDFRDFQDFDWTTLREETRKIRNLSKELGLWIVLGSAHYLDAETKPTNCLYLINPQGEIVDRYDKSMCTGRDQDSYTAGNRLVTRTINGVKVGLAICYDGCWPQIYAAYHQQGVTVMLHSFHNARSGGPNCLDDLVIRQVPTRCSDYRMWAVANNSSAPYSHWASFVARPDSTITGQLEQNKPGMLVHEFPDGLSEGGWYHNFQPMLPRDDERFTNGTPSSHPRQLDPTCEP
ncbi:carbon-nitrogen hydrolase family protein [Aeoliella mucimassa]|uniref:carbon-nitrogen hydrolase family protein n=1 Tax=Aeoliella mucimassa TaxID=2527972 RepID=UPI001E536FB0|nr:carbon-nitrogen hydrolase family protein [Aeoliella mucimassa]